MNTILAFLVSKGGSVISPIIAALVAYLVSKLALLSPEVASQVNQAELTAWIWGLLVAVLNYATNKAQTEGVEKIQEQISTVVPKVEVDGIPGPVTVTAVADTVKKLFSK